MENTNAKEYYTIDLMQILRALWQRAWIIALAGLLTASFAFAYSAFFIPPTYASSIMLYVNNASRSPNEANSSISVSEITAAQNLVKTYSEILNNKTTLERVIAKAGVDLTYKELSGMIVAVPSNETEVMKVTVTTQSPNDSAKIANCIAEVLPARIAEIIDGASMEVVDLAVPNHDKVAPSITKYTIIGMILGVAVAVIILAVISIMDDTIHDEEYILQNYDIPILAKIPDLLSSGGKKYKYGYYYKRSKNVYKQ